MNTLARSLFVAMLFMVSGCAKTSVEVTADLWNEWNNIDQLVQTDYPDAIPIILIHGWNGSEFSWPSARVLKAMEGRLGRDIYFFTYRSGVLGERFPPLEILEEELEHFLVNFRKVDVVAHSMGGLLIREYLLHHPNERIRRIVFLSTPHFGTNAAKFLSGIADVSPLGNLQAEEMRPGSRFLWQLNEAEAEELKPLEVLNVYVKDTSLIKSDAIVGEHSAYLNGQHNVVIEGNHHTLPKRMDEFDFITQFLMHGTVPPEAEKPKRRDLWVRIRDTSHNRYLTLKESSIQRISRKGIPESGSVGIALCCSAASSLGDESGNTLIIEDLQAGEKLMFFLRGGFHNIEIDADSLLDSPNPVIMKELTVSPEQ